MPVTIQSSKPVFLRDEEFAVLTRLVDWILPRTDTPGAVDARAHFLIDGAAARNSSQGDRLRLALKQYDQHARERFEKGFAALAEAQQVELLKEGGPHFELIKGLTCDAYYSTREGLVQELGWHANTYLTQFQGCTHPEHQIDEAK